MRISVAQTRPVKGDIHKNIINHKKLLDLAIDQSSDIIIFPELSLTGYEPELAKELATDKDDIRLDVFQKISDNKHITIGVGLPTKNKDGICISMILFQPNSQRQTYSKKYLHSDEEPFFISGVNSNEFISNKRNVALAICYELSVPAHSQNAYEKGGEFYVTSAVKTVDGVKRAIQQLSDIATKYSMTVLLANCIGHSGGYDCGGKSSVWNDKGLLVGQLNDTAEGILIFDTETQEVIQKTLK
jgi:predicted amidohydrolase